jgi:hypothetical protein
MLYDHKKLAFFKIESKCPFHFSPLDRSYRNFYLSWQAILESLLFIMDSGLKVINANPSYETYNEWVTDSGF